TTTRTPTTCSTGPPTPASCRLSKRLTALMTRATWGLWRARQGGSGAPGARAAGPFGAHGLVFPSRRGAGVTAGAWKASAGALARVPVARAANLARALASYRDAGAFVAGLDEGGCPPVRELELATAPLVLVIGSEGRGLSRIVTQACDVLVR